MNPHKLFAQTDIIRLNICSNWHFRQKDQQQWYPAKVPGCIHTDLLSNKLIDDPYYRTNEKKLQWIDKKDWIYETHFSVDENVFAKQNILVDFKGLDTYATIYLNGIEIGRTDNMFREWIIDCKKNIKKGDNILTIDFESPIQKTIPLFDSLTFHYPAPNDQSENGEIGDKKVSIFTRKAGYQYGWDWGPRFVTSGIWRNASIIAYNNLLITDNTFNTIEVHDNKAQIKSSVTLQSSQEQSISIELQLDDSTIAQSTVKIPIGTSTHTFQFDVINPRLWWCNGMGSPELYSFKVIIRKENIVLDRNDKKVGIRTIEVVHEKDKLGKSFYFKINGLPVFMKGANYIPIDNFPSRISDSRYKDVIKSAADANMNMLRVWGGGIYENDIFYDLCDANGILIWQDFMFACSMYPGDKAFLDNVKREAIDNVKRLRNHPCIALWCGNNEINTAWNGWGWKPQFEKESPQIAQKLWHDYDTLFNVILKDVVENYTFDKQRFYWPSSPMASFNEKAGNLNSGDIHYWDVWHFGKPFKEYLNNVGRFMSEYGFQSFPELQTIEQYTTPSDRDITSDVMMAHQRHPRGNELIKTYMGYYYKTPKNFEQFLYVGQILQAEGIKLAIEAHRRAMPHCMGSLYWQLNDCWPVASWSSTDYYGRWKALHYFVKNAYANVLISPVINEQAIELNIISDETSNFKTRLTCRLIDFDGKQLWKDTATITAKALSCSKTNLPFSIPQSVKKEFSRAVLVVTSDIIHIASSYSYFVDPKDMVLPKPNITAELRTAENGYVLTLKTDKLAKNVYLTSTADCFFSDNYFDIMPGDFHVLHIKTNAKLELKDINIHSLVDAF